MEPETRKGNPLLRVLEAIADIAIVGILWARCSLPVITLGAATVGAYRAGGVLSEPKHSLSREFFRAFREVCGDAWHICAETSLHVPRGLVETAAETVDGFIIDIKDMNSEIYHRYTGGDAGLVQENLAYLLDKVGPERLLVRVPLIPDFNTPADCDTSEQRLRAMGVTRIDRFSYIRREV